MNYAKPLYVSGIEMAQRFIGMTGYPALGMCSACAKKLLDPIKAAIRDVPVELSGPLLSEGARKWAKSPNQECVECGWKGHERQLGQLRTLMGDGYYYGKCPNCGAENRFLGKTCIKFREGFEMVEIQEIKQTNEYKAPAP